MEVHCSCQNYIQISFDHTVTGGGGGGGVNWTMAKFFLYNSKTVQSIFNKFCDFNYTYIGLFFKTDSLGIDVSLLPR